MFKKILFFLVVLTVAASTLTGCKPSSGGTSNVSPTDLMKVLNNKSTAIAIKPGWLHVTEHIIYDVDKENLGVLPNDTVIPLEHVIDTWYHINDQGQVYQYVQSQNSMPGDVIQVSVFMDQVIINLMTNFVLPLTPYSLGALDYHFSNEVDNYITATGKDPVLQLTTVDDHNAAVFTISETYDSPTVTENYTEPVFSTRTIAYYDTDSGLLFRLERIRIFEDGSERTYFRTDIVVVRDVTPPKDILDYLNHIN